MSLHRVSINRVDQSTMFVDKVVVSQECESVNGENV